MGNERDVQKHGQRVLVMWLCWLALAMFLIAAGVVGFAQFADVASAPEAGPRRAAESVAAAVPESSPGAAARDEADAPRPATDVQRASAVDEVRSVRVRFLQHCSGMEDSHYVGAVQLHVDGAPLPPLQIRNCDPVALALPRAARHLRCDAPGCEPVEQELPPPQAWPEPIEVKFFAGANLVFDVVGLPAGWQGVPSFVAASAEHAVQVLDVANWIPGSRTSCAFLPGAEFAWRAMLRGASSVWVVEGRERALQVGEQRTVVVDCSGTKPVRYQVVGPSAQLMPHLVVLVQPPLDGLNPLQGVKLPLGETGCFELHGAAGWAFGIGVRGGFGELREEPSADGVLLLPPNPLVGLQWCDRTGQGVEFSLCQHLDRFHVHDRSNLPEQMLVECDAGGPLRIRATDLPTDTDVIDLARLPSQALGAIAVTVRGERPPWRCRMQALRADGSVAADEAATATTDLPNLDPGTYDVRWYFAEAPGPWVAQRVSVVAGSTKALLADWPADGPAMVAWTGEIAGHVEAPAAQRFLNVRFGNHARLTEGSWMRVDDGGGFRFGLPEAKQPDAVVTLRLAFMMVRADVVSVDRERRHLVVRPAEGLRWIDVQVEGEAGLAWCAHLSSPGVDLPWMMLWSREQRPIVVPPGVVLGGALFAGAYLGDVTAWFEVDGTQSPVLVRRAQGRTVEFRNAGAAGRTLTLVGPRGQYDYGHQLSGEPLRLFVPDGTRGIWIHDPAQPNASRPEHAIEPGDVMFVR